MGIIQPLTADYEDYLHDESRSTGFAELIAFPETEEEMRDVMRDLHARGLPITLQGARTGLAAGAVPQGGCVINLARMRRFTGMRVDDGRFFVSVQPGVMLLELRQALRTRSFDTQGWSDASRAALELFNAAEQQGFPVDPTEISASIGGVAACNASGAMSYRFGAVRGHITALRMVLADGDVLSLRRGEVCAEEGTLQLTTEGGRTLSPILPSYVMPQAKCASGYFVAPRMDAIDALIGSDGTLGAITQLELALTPQAASVWDACCFVPDEATAIAFVERARAAAHATSIEYIDANALAILRERQAEIAAHVPQGETLCCVAVQIACDDDDEAMTDLEHLVLALEEVGGDANAAWVASTAAEREQQRAFRHAVPESVNQLIDERRSTHPRITKLGSDMAVPKERLGDAMTLYRSTLAHEELESATWGHIGDAHLHVNILPRNEEDYARGKALLAQWAAEISAMGGAVSAEHGVGKLKRDFLATMYGTQALREMARFKLAFDRLGQLGRGTFFDAALLDEERAALKTSSRPEGCPEP